MTVRRWILSLATIGGVLLTACSGTAEQQSGALAQTGGVGAAAAAAPTAAAKPSDGTPDQSNPPAKSSGATTELNMDELFPPGEGRELVLQYCTNCHTITPILLTRFDADGWKSHRANHQSRVPGLTDAQADILWAYLTEHFNPSRPIPELPEEMLQTWTSY